MASYRAETIYLWILRGRFGLSPRVFSAHRILLTRCIVLQFPGSSQLLLVLCSLLFGLTEIVEIFPAVTRQIIRCEYHDETRVCVTIVQVLESESNDSERIQIPLERSRLSIR